MNRCNSLCSVTSSVVEKTDFLYMELGVELAIVTSEVVNLGGKSYHLPSLVRRWRSYFTCEIASNLPSKELIYFNDLHDDSIIFLSFQLLTYHMSGAGVW